MSPSDVPQQDRTGPAGKEELLQAFNAVVDSERAHLAKRREPPPPPPKPRTRLGTAFVGALAYIGLIYVWVGRPVWLFGPPVATSVQDTEASLRFALYLQAAALEDYVSLNGATPATFEEAGEPDSSISYTRVSDTEWILTGSEGSTTLTLRSDMPLDAFLGSALERLEDPPN